MRVLSACFITHIGLWDPIVEVNRPRTERNHTWHRSVIILDSRLLRKENWNAWYFSFKFSAYLLGKTVASASSACLFVHGKARRLDFQSYGRLSATEIMIQHWLRTKHLLMEGNRRLGYCLKHSMVEGNKWGALPAEIRRSKMMHRNTKEDGH
jgi:hypothetical protein